MIEISEEGVVFCGDETKLMCSLWLEARTRCVFCPLAQIAKLLS